MSLERFQRVIIPLTSNRPKIALFRECLNGTPKQDRHSGLTFLPCSDTWSMLFRVSLSVWMDTDTDTGSFIGSCWVSVWLWQLALMFLSRYRNRFSESLVTALQCRCMRFSGIGSIITPPHINLSNLTYFVNVWTEYPTRIDTGSGSWRSCPVPCSFGCPCRSEWIPIPQQALSSALVGCRSDCGSLLWCSFTLFFVYYINYMVLHCITYTFFSFIPCFFSLSEYLFYNQSMYYTKIHGITSCITLSAL